ncbi:MAG: hypothetical protein KDA81_00510 [Planctomycetaceae bacterium]|nr:hypothetical protein [Planctomycetaceae bacterium]
MMIQRTLLLGLASFMTIHTANAQCSRSARTVTLRPQHGHSVAYPDPVYPITASTCPLAGTRHTVELPPEPAAVVPGSYGHVDELAQRLEILMNEVCLDMYYNYSHNPEFRETYSEAYSLFLTAQYIHAMEHHYDRAAIQRQLGGADALFHHVEDDVAGWTRIPRRQIGTLGLRTKMKLAEETLHHLMEYVGVSATAAVAQPPAPGAIAFAPAP